MSEHPGWPHPRLAGAGMADDRDLEEEREEEDEEDDEDSASDEEAEGGAMAGFLFGNVDRNMRVDATYMDEEALEHLAALGSKQLGGALGQLEVWPCSGTGVFIRAAMKAMQATPAIAAELCCAEATRGTQGLAKAKPGDGNGKAASSAGGVAKDALDYSDEEELAADEVSPQPAEAPTQSVAPASALG